MLAIERQPERCANVVRSVYPNAALVKHRGRFRVVTRCDPYSTGRAYLGRWCGSEQRAWQAAFRVTIREAFVRG